MSTPSIVELREMMARFASRRDCGQGIAGEIEVALDELFGDEEPFASLALALASYRPEGGPYLYGIDEMIPMMERALDALRNRDSG